MYMERNSSLLIDGISTGLFNSDQVEISADASAEGGVIFDSAMSVVQGLWPPTSEYNATLANGTVVVAPLNGYQYVPSRSPIVGLPYSVIELIVDILSSREH